MSGRQHSTTVRLFPRPVSGGADNVTSVIRPIRSLRGFERNGDFAIVRRRGGYRGTTIEFIIVLALASVSGWAKPTAS